MQMGSKSSLSIIVISLIDFNKHLHQIALQALKYARFFHQDRSIIPWEINMNVAETCNFAVWVYSLGQDLFSIQVSWKCVILLTNQASNQWTWLKDDLVNTDFGFMLDMNTGPMAESLFDPSVNRNLQPSPQPQPACMKAESLKMCYL